MFRKLFAVATILLIASWILALAVVVSAGGRSFTAGPNRSDALAIVAEYYDAINQQIRSGSQDRLRRIVRDDPKDSAEVAMAKRETLDRRVGRIRAISPEASIRFEVTAVSHELVIVRTDVAIPDSPAHLFGLDVVRLPLWPEFESLRIIGGRISILDDFARDELSFSGLDLAPGVGKFDVHQVIDPLIFSFLKPGDKHFATGDSSGFIIPLTSSFVVKLIDGNEQSGTIANRVDNGDLIEQVSLKPGREASIESGNIVMIPPGSGVVLTPLSSDPAVVLGLAVMVRHHHLYDVTPMESELVTPGTSVVIQATLLPSQIAVSRPLQLRMGVVLIPPGKIASLDSAATSVITVPLVGETRLLTARSEVTSVDSATNDSFMSRQALTQEALIESESAEVLDSLTFQARLMAYSTGVDFTTETASGFILNSGNQPAAAWVLSLLPAR